MRNKNVGNFTFERCTEELYELFADRALKGFAKPELPRQGSGL